MAYRIRMDDFNPRTREGCDFGHINDDAAGHYFNPRTREGCDYRYGRWTHYHADISIHAPVKGATGRVFNEGPPPA